MEADIDGSLHLSDTGTSVRLMNAREEIAELIY
jgi:hypothetical protein